MAENYDNGDKDRRELLKLKQGLVDEKDSNIKETGYDVRMAQTPGEKTKNFLWYHKVMIVVGILLIARSSYLCGVLCKEKAGYYNLQPRKLRYVHPHGI